jgi:hypothetical protein
MFPRLALCCVRQPPKWLVEQHKRRSPGLLAGERGDFDFTFPEFPDRLPSPGPTPSRACALPDSQMSACEKALSADEHSWRGVGQRENVVRGMGKRNPT